jgi:hypothetical protein
MLAMAAYMGVLFGANALLRTTASLPVKALLALLPTLPVLYVIALMWRRIQGSDELEQRTHLLALGAAAALLSAASLIGGFLAGGGVLHLGGDVLIWVFPALMASYGVAYQRVARHYGIECDCAEERSAWLPWYFAGTGVVMAALALYLWIQYAAASALVLLAAAAFFCMLAVRVRRQRARAARETTRDRA